VSRSLAGAPGVALAIVHGDQVTHVRGFGTADGERAQVTPDTPFVIGSQSKSFTALAIMQLSESGLLDLDAPVQRYLPWFRVADPGYSARITVRHLLNGTSGLPHSAPFDTAVTSVTQRVRDLATVRLLAPPGQLWAYPNSSYEVLGLVIEAVSGQSYGDYVEQHIFAPLDMQQSFASESQAQQHGLAVGHQWWFGLTVPVDTYRADYVPDSYLVSSASDMSHYLIAQLHRVASTTAIGRCRQQASTRCTPASSRLGPAVRMAWDGFRTPTTGPLSSPTTATH
jgi:CubicO group peptidase (beta-lactamase class C family)